VNLHYFENELAKLEKIEVRSDGSVVATLSDDTETVVIHLSRKAAAELALNMTTMLTAEALEQINDSSR